MQKTIIAAAIIGLVSAGSMAATVYDKDGTKVSVGGKFDFALVHKDAGDKQTTYVAGDRYGTSRVTFGAEEALNSDVTAYFSVDLRFGDMYLGKAGDSTILDGKTGKAAPGGLNTNDAKKGGLVSKKYGRFEAGEINVAAQQFVFKKNYVNKAESELVKYGVSSMGLEALSNRTMYAHTTAELPVVLKASYSFSDVGANDLQIGNTDGKSGTAATPANVTQNKKGMYSVGVEGKYSIANVGAAVVVKPNTNQSGQGNELKHYEGFIAAEQNGAKVSFFASHDSAEFAGKSGSGFGLNAYYLVGDKIDLGIALQRYVDTTKTAGVKKNSGKGYMAGVHYYASKGVTFYAGVRMDNWEAEETIIGGKILGNKAGFTDDLKKNDQRLVFTGMNFAF